MRNSRKMRLPLAKCICYPSSRMGQTKFFLLVWLFFCTVALHAGTYTLNNGQTVNGDPISYDRTGVVFGNNLAKRIAWTQFTQESLHTLKAEAKHPQDGEFIDPFLQENIAQQAQQKEIVVKQPTRVELPKGRVGILAGFASPLGLVLFLIVYAANLFAAYEIALFKNRPIAVVCGASAVLPLLAPIVFLLIPAVPKYEPEVDPFAPKETAPPAAAEPAAEPQPAEPAAVVDSPQQHVPAAPSPAPSRPRTQSQFVLPTKQKPAEKTEEATPTTTAAATGPTVTFKRGEFTFNRRFLETKLPAFLRVVPGEADKDMVLLVKCARGEFVGKRISRVTQTDFHLEVFKEGATADEMIPYNEIYEIQMRHKDSV